MRQTSILVCRYRLGYLNKDHDYYIYSDWEYLLSRLSPESALRKWHSVLDLLDIKKKRHSADHVEVKIICIRERQLGCWVDVTEPSKSYPIPARFWQ